jgi:CubicO group peptidase (beta-lactamase class C family)
LLHQAQLKSWIPFYRETIDSSGAPLSQIYSASYSKDYSIEVAANLYMRTTWRDTMHKRIVQSALEAPNKYIYSDNDFIFLGLIVEKISGMSLDKYVQQHFYTPLGLKHTGFNAHKNLPTHLIVPTENEKAFRQQLLNGYVHDPGAAMFGGVAGHAGLFSTAAELAVIMQMLLNKGSFGGKQYLQPTTIQLFNQYHSTISRRGLGFDKPEKDNSTRKEPYPAKWVSANTFGHTGFTGTCVWADADNDLIYIFLSNRVHPLGGDNTKLLKQNVRPQIHDVFYESIFNK